MRILHFLKDGTKEEREIDHDDPNGIPPILWPPGDPKFRLIVWTTSSNSELVRYEYHEIGEAE